MAIRKNRLDQLINYWDPRVRSAFLDAIGNVRDQAQQSQIIRMLEQGNVEGAIRAVGLKPAQFRVIDKTIGTVFEAGGEFTAASIPRSYTSDGFRTTFQFNIRNPTAERWLQNWAATKVTEIIRDQEIMIRETLVDNLSKGYGPRRMTLDLVGRIGPNGTRTGGLIGLTSSQAEWVRAYHDELTSNNPADALSRKLRDRRFDGAVRRAAVSGQPIDADLIDKMVDSYENRALAYRAEAIARTETMGALHEAQQQAIEQAVEEGAVPPEAVGFVWRITDDNRVRHSHETMDGQRRGLGEMFETGNGVLLKYPGDPSGPPEEIIKCRCWREPDIDFLAGVE